VPILREVAAYFALLMQIGILIAASVFLGFYAGSWLDRRLGTGMVFTMVGVIMGVGAGFWTAYRTIMKVSKNSDDAKDR